MCVVQPNVTSVSPLKGPDSGNTPLTITGYNFLNTPTTYCNFSNGAVFQTVPAVNITSTMLVCLSPPLCTRSQVAGCLQLTAVVAVEISVTNNNLQYGDTSVTFEYFGMGNKFIHIVAFNHVQHCHRFFQRNPLAARSQAALW